MLELDGDELEPGAEPELEAGAELPEDEAADEDPEAGAEEAESLGAAEAKAPPEGATGLAKAPVGEAEPLAKTVLTTVFIELEPDAGAPPVG